ncbi:unnamed protein product [Rhodiola kirilowii]
MYKTTSKKKSLHHLQTALDLETTSFIARASSFCLTSPLSNLNRAPIRKNAAATPWMEESKAAEYYEELTRKGEGAARFKQGLGFASSTASNHDDAVPVRGSALPSSSSSFLSSFVRASSPTKTSEFEKQSQLKSIQNKLKKKHDREPSSARVSDKRNGDMDRINRSSRRRSRSRSREHDSRRQRRSVSRDRDKDRYRDEDRDRRRRRRSRSDSDEDRRRRRDRRRRSRSSSPCRNGEKVGKDGEMQKKEKIDYGKVIEGYDKMVRALSAKVCVRFPQNEIGNSNWQAKTRITVFALVFDAGATPAERVKAKTKFQLAETDGLHDIYSSVNVMTTAEKDATKGMGSGWERFEFDKDAPLDDEETVAVEDDAALVKHIGQTFRYSAVEARRAEEIKIAHDEAMFGGGASALAPNISDDEPEVEDKVQKGKHSDPESSSLVNEKVLVKQQGSWRNRVRKS